MTYVERRRFSFRNLTVDCLTANGRLSHHQLPFYIVFYEKRWSNRVLPEFCGMPPLFSVQMPLGRTVPSAEATMKDRLLMCASCVAERVSEWPFCDCWRTDIYRNSRRNGGTTRENAPWKMARYETSDQILKTRCYREQK